MQITTVENAPLKDTLSSSRKLFIDTLDTKLTNDGFTKSKTDREHREGLNYYLSDFKYKRTDLFHDIYASSVYQKGYGLASAIKSINSMLVSAVMIGAYNDGNTVEYVVYVKFDADSYEQVGDTFVDVAKDHKLIRGTLDALVAKYPLPANTTFNIVYV